MSPTACLTVMLTPWIWKRALRRPAAPPAPPRAAAAPGPAPPPARLRTPASPARPRRQAAPALSPAPTPQVRAAPSPDGAAAWPAPRPSARDLHAFEQQRGGWGRHGQPAVLGLDPPVPDRDREVVDRLDPEALEPLDRAHHVEHGVDGTHFVQMDLFGGDSMHLALRFADQPERPQRALLHPIGHGASLDQPH